MLAASDGLRSTVLTHNNEDNDIYCCPTWTPNGRNIVFTSFVAGRPPQPPSYRFWIYQQEDSNQRLILDSNTRFSFLGLDESGNNALIAQKADPADLSSTPESTYVYSLSLQTGARLKVNTLSHAYFHNIHLSRDGRFLAFVSRRDNTTALWTVPVNKPTPKRLLAENDPKVLISSLAWSPDGGSIVFGKQTRTNLLSMLAK